MTRQADGPQTQPLANAEKAFRAFLEATSLSEELHRNHIHLRHSYGRNNAFLGWDDPPFRAAIKVIQQASPQVSERTIGAVLTESMIKLFEEHAIEQGVDSGGELHLDTILPSLPNAAIEEEVRNIIDYVQDQVESHTVFVPLEGIEPLSSEIRIGHSIVYANDRGPLPALLQERTKDKAWKRIVKYCDQVLAAAGCYVAVDEEGDDTAASALALQDAQDLVDILNLYVASALDRDRGLGKIAVMGQVGILGEQIVVFARVAAEGESRTVLGFKARKPPRRRHKIRTANPQEWKQCGLEQVVASFTYVGSNPTAIESRLRRSVRWYSKGISADSTDEQFVALAVALESLLIGSEGIGLRVSWGSITQRLADRVAFLLGSGYDQRADLERDVKRLYRLRSKVVHQGGMVSRLNLASMDSIACSTIQAFANQGFRSWDEFLEWESKRKYSE